MSRTVFLYVALYFFCYMVMRGAQRFTSNMRSLETLEKETHERSVLDTALQALVLFAGLTLKSGLLYLSDLENSASGIQKNSVIDIAEGINVGVAPFIDYAFAVSIGISVLLIVVFSVSRVRLSAYAEKTRIQADIPDGAVSVDRVLQMYLHIVVIALFAWILSGYASYKFFA